MLRLQIKSTTSWTLQGLGGDAEENGLLISLIIYTVLVMKPRTRALPQCVYFLLTQGLM